MKTKTLSGLTMEIHTVGRPNYSIVFSTDKTDELMVKLIRDKLIKQIGASVFEFECNSDETFELLKKTSAK